MRCNHRRCLGSIRICSFLECRWGFVRTDYTSKSIQMILMSPRIFVQKGNTACTIYLRLLNFNNLRFYLFFKSILMCLNCSKLWCHAVFKSLLLFLAFNNCSSQGIYVLKEFKDLLGHKRRVGCFRRLGKGLRHDSGVEVGIWYCGGCWDEDGSGKKSVAVVVE